jgi:hypothetical protein
MSRSRFEVFETTGLWTLADTELEPQLGVFRYDPAEGLRLEMQWMAQEEADKWVRTAGLSSVNVIGKHWGDWAVSLEGCLVIPGRSSSGRACLTLPASRVFVGTGSPTPADLSVDYIVFTAMGLPSFCGHIAGLPRSPWSIDNEARIARLEYRQPESIEARLGPVSFTLHFAYSPGSNNRSASIKEYPEIGFGFEEPVSFEAAERDFVRPLVDLLTLATLRPSETDSLQFIHPRSEEADHDGDLVDVLWKPRGGKEERELHEVEMLFTLRDVEKHLGVGQMLSRWLGLYEKAGYSMAAYFGTHYASFQYVETRFLQTVQACEDLDRKTRQTVADLDDFLQYADRVMEAVGDRLSRPDRERLEASLRYRREPTLHDRIMALTGPQSAIARQIVFDPEFFARSVVKTRNYLTHGRESPMAVKDIADQARLTRVLDYLLRDRLLEEIGFDTDTRRELFHRNWRLQESVPSW